MSKELKRVRRDLKKQRQMTAAQMRYASSLASGKAAKKFEKEMTR